MIFIIYNSQLLYSLSCDFILSTLLYMFHYSDYCQYPYYSRKSNLVIAASFINLFFSDVSCPYFRRNILLQTFITKFHIFIIFDRWEIEYCGSQVSFSYFDITLPYVSKYLFISILSRYHLFISCFNPLKAKHGLFYLKTQYVPRCKHFSSRL
jgi:hypothetical protein